MRILVLDDHPLFREGLKYMLLRLHQEVDIQECGCFEDAIQLAERDEHFDLILADLQLPGMSGLEVVRRVRDAFVDARVVVVSSDIEPDTVSASIEAGAMGYVPKTASPAILLNALRLILDNGVYLPAEILLAAQAAGSTQDRQPGAPHLTPQQMNVLKLLVQGRPNKTIAKVLGIGEETVKTHVKAVLRAVGAGNRTEAVYASARLNLRLD